MLGVFRAAASLHMVPLGLQPLFAGLFLDGRFGMLSIHGTLGSAVVFTAILQVIAAILLWRPGRVAGWPIGVAVAIWVAEVVQLVAGYTRAVALHLPLGVALVVAQVLLTAWAWRRRPEATR